MRRVFERADRSSQGRGVWASGVTLAMVAGWLSALGAISAGPTLCPIALLTGTACPGCGMTRAIVELVQGDLRSSWDAHALAVVVLAEAVVFLGRWGAGLRGYFPQLSTKQASVAGAATAVGLIVVWSLRYTSGTLPPV